MLNHLHPEKELVPECFPPTGHAIAGVLRGLLCSSSQFQLIGPSSATTVTLTPTPLDLFRKPFVPLAWNPQSHLYQALMSDPCHPQPLVTLGMLPDDEDEDDVVILTPAVTRNIVSTTTML